MSRLWPDELLCVLSPQHLALIDKSLFGRGSGQNISRTLAADEDDHQAVLAAFEQALAQFEGKRSRLRLVLAGAFARYALTMPVTALLSAEEEAALARQCFIQRFGEASQAWVVRHKVQGLGEPFFCCAAPAALLDGIKALCTSRKIQPVSAEPLLAFAWQEARRKLPGRAGWLAVTEPGRVHLIALSNRAWVQLASTRTHDGWETALATLLQREASVLGRSADEPLWLIGAAPGMTLPDARPWRWLTAPQSDAPYLDLVMG